MAETDLSLEKRSRFNYGWVTIFLAAVLMLATLPGRTQGLGLITEPLLKDLHLDRVLYARINLWATLLGAVFCFPAGFLIDRFGMRIVSSALVLLLGATVWAMSGYAGNAGGLFVLLLLTRALGQSALSVASITAAGKAFGKGIGWAMGVYSFLLSFFFVIAFVVVGSSVTHRGWRSAWHEIAIALFVIGPLTMIFLRGRDRTATTTPAFPAGAPVGSFNLAQALATPAFWIFGLGAALFNLVSSGLGLFNEDVLAERGFDQNTYHNFLAVTTMAALIGQLVCGWRARTWPLRRLMTIALFLYAAALGMIPWTKSLPALWFLAALIGVAGGFITVVFFGIWTQVFGRAHLGRIQGAAQALAVLASAIGPLAFAQCFAATGSYTSILLALAATVFVLACAAWKVALPKIREPDASISPTAVEPA